MQIDVSRYLVKLAESEAERAGAQRLRYRVFVEEMGARATPEEVAARREWDDFDAVSRRTELDIDTVVLTWKV